MNLEAYPAKHPYRTPEVSFIGELSDIVRGTSGVKFTGSAQTDSVKNSVQLIIHGTVFAAPLS